MESSEILHEKDNLLIDENMIATSSFKGSDQIGSDSASYEKFILDLDSYWDELNDRLSVSRMVSDSVIKGMVNAIAEEAKEELSLKEAEIAILNNKLQSSRSDETHVQNFYAVSTLKNSFVMESKVNDAWGSCKSCLSATKNCHVADNIERLRLTVDDLIQKLKKDVEHFKSSEMMIREDISPCNISHKFISSRIFQELDEKVDALKDILAVGFEQISAVIFSQNAMHSEYQCEYELQREVTRIVLQDYVRSLQDEYETKLYKQSMLIKDLNKDCQKKVSELCILRGELHAIYEEVNNHDNFEEWSVAKRKEYYPSKVLGNHRYPSQPEENGTSTVETIGDSGEHVLDLADLSQLKHMSREELLAYCKNEMTNMRRRHDSALQEKTEELFRLKREFLKEKGSLPFRKDREIENLRKKLPEFISMLDEILVNKDILSTTYSHNDELCSFKERINLLYSENKHLQSLLMKKTIDLKYLSEQISDAADRTSLHLSIEANYLKQIRKLECDVEDVKAEADLRDAVVNNALRGLIGDHNDIMQGSDIEIKALMEIYTTIFSGVVCDTISSMNPAISECFKEKTSLEGLVLEKEKALMSKIEENQKLKQVAESISSSIKEKEKLALEVSSTLMQLNQQLVAANQEINMLRDQISIHELHISGYEKESNSLRNRLSEALQQIQHYELESNQLKEKYHNVSCVLKETEDHKTMLLRVLEDKQRTLSSSLEKDKEQVNQLESITAFINEISNKIIADFEIRLTENINRNESRLKFLAHQLNPLLQLASQQKKKCLWYKNMLEIKSSNLQKAETEVDLLADDLDALFRLLEMIYLALDHYSPVLQHYPGVMEILKLIQIELNGENN